MKVKIIALSKTDGYDGDEYEYCGLEPGGVYDVVTINEDLDAVIVENRMKRNVLVYMNEVEVYED